MNELFPTLVLLLDAFEDVLYQEYGYNDPEDCTYSNLWKEAWIRTKEAIKEGKQSPWISVKDRLPEFCELLFYSDGHVYKGSFYPEEQFFSDHQEYYTITEVTHWMPLPEPPEGAKR